jgi:2-dehydropantoate 2-reductase
MARIAIVGPGAIGGVMAAWLQDTGANQVVLCARRPLPRLTVETPGKTIAFAPVVWTDPNMASPVDWVLVATKAYEADPTGRWLAALTAGGAPAAILQNGVEHRERFAPYLPIERILPVVVQCPAERPEPTRMLQRGPTRLVVPDGALGSSFAALFAGTAVGIDLSPDFQTALWTKLTFNCAGAVSALLLRAAEVMGDPSGAEAARLLMRECIAVGRAEGAVLRDDLTETVLQGYGRQPPDMLNSLHADRLAGRPMEIDARNGAIVRFGRKHGIPTPCNQLAVNLLQAIAKPAPGPAR